jgi:hypothetical protein
MELIGYPARPVRSCDVRVSGRQLSGVAQSESQSQRRMQVPWSPTAMPRLVRMNFSDTCLARVNVPWTFRPMVPVRKTG